MLFLLSLFTALKYSKNKILNEQCNYAAEFFNNLNLVHKYSKILRILFAAENEKLVFMIVGEHIEQP